MRIGWVLGSLFLFMIGTLISLALQLQYVDSSTTHTLSTLLSPTFAAYSNPLAAVGGFFLWLWDWLLTFWNVLTWNYSFFVGDWALLRMFGWGISISLALSFMFAIRGTPTF